MKYAGVPVLARVPASFLPTAPDLPIPQTMARPLISSRNATALKERGIILYRAGSPDEAAEWLREALRWDTTGEERAEIEFYLALLEGTAGGETPSGVITAIARADTLAKIGRIVEAVEVLEEAARLAPHSGEPLRRQALLKRDMGLLDEALELMADALRLDPALDNGHYMYGVYLNEAGRHDEALELASQLILSQYAVREQIRQHLMAVQRSLIHDK